MSAETDRSGDTARIEAEAAVWLSLRDRGMTETETTRFVHWFQEDRRHAEVFESLDRTWSQFSVLTPARKIPLADMDPDLLAPRTRPPVDRFAWKAVAGLAAALVLVFIGVAKFGTGSAIETTVGGFQRLDLPDGSVMQMNTDTVVRIRYNAAERRVLLSRGEAHFIVTKDPVRPFIVAARGVAVRAVGTAFNVRLRDDSVDVLVTEGRVQVLDDKRGGSLLGAGTAGEPSLLVAGERALIPDARTVGAPAAVRVSEASSVEIDHALAWQERRLEFESVTLAEVVAEFNRYNRHKLVIEDPRLAARLFGGTFRADGYDALVGLLENNFDVVAVREADRTLLRARR